MQTLDLRGSSVVLPSYGWRAPGWTNARHYPALYDDHPNLLLECTLLDELEPDLECWRAARRDRPPAKDPLVHDDDERPFGPEDYLRELERVRSEARGVLKGICQRLQARRDAGHVYEKFVEGTFGFWKKHLGCDNALMPHLIGQKAVADKVALLRQALDGRAGTAEQADDLAALERLVERQVEVDQAAMRQPEDEEREYYARTDLYDEVHQMVHRIHHLRAHPVKRTIPRAPPCDPEHSLGDSFELPVTALRAMPRYVRDLAEIDAFLATGRMPRPEEYLPPPEERFDTLVRARAILCEILERGAKVCVADRDAREQLRALSELRGLCLDVIARCGLLDQLRPGVMVLADDQVHDVAAELLSVLLSSDHPLAKHATARVSAAMALTPRDVPERVALDLPSRHLSDEDNKLVWDAKMVVYGEVSDDVLY